MGQLLATLNMCSMLLYCDIKWLFVMEILYYGYTMFVFCCAVILARTEGLVNNHFVLLSVCF